MLNIIYNKKCINCLKDVYSLVKKIMFINTQFGFDYFLKNYTQKVIQENNNNNSIRGLYYSLFFLFTLINTYNNNNKLYTI